MSAISHETHECHCARTLGVPADAFGGVYHWRWDCPYLKPEEREACRALFAAEAKALGVEVPDAGR